MADLVRYLITLDLKNEALDLISKVGLEAANADGRTLEVILMPFLPSLQQVMEEQKIPPTIQIYQYLFQQVIPLSISRYIDIEPTRPMDDAYPRAGCSSPGCRDCQDFGTFCVARDCHIWQLKSTSDRRYHIEKLVDQDPRNFRATSIRNSRAPYTLQVTKTPYEAW